MTISFVFPNAARAQSTGHKNQKDTMESPFGDANGVVLVMIPAVVGQYLNPCHLDLNEHGSGTTAKLMRVRNGD